MGFNDFVVEPGCFSLRGEVMDRLNNILLRGRRQEKMYINNRIGRIAELEQYYAKK